jgi:hypothetical protein
MTDQVPSETLDKRLLVSSIGRILDLEHKVKTLEFAIDTLTRQLRDLNYRIDRNRGVDRSD